jgi:hypothetical protein
VIRKTLFVSLVVGLMGCVAHGATSGRVVIKDENVKVDVAFSDRDRVLIQDYYTKGKKKEKGMPPGLAKRNGALPPGLAKREQLPPGLAKRSALPADIRGEPLPAELEAKLSPLPTGYVRIRVGQDFVLFDRKTRVVFDVAYGLGD